MRYVILVATVMSIVFALPAFADCQSDIDELKAQIDDQKADYTREARKEAPQALSEGGTRQGRCEGVQG